MASFKLLNEALHGSEHTTDPYYTVGKITPSMIRWLDEKPQEFGRIRQCRPVELTHPDVKGNQTPHGFFSHAFELIMHDLLHCWRGSAITEKPFIRHLRQINDSTGFQMSKTTWIPI